MKTYLYKIVDENGNSLNGFKTKAEAEASLPLMKEGRKWQIASYVADDIDKQNLFIK